ncbi:MAG: hypothetical protein PHG19_07495 [Anaerotignum sp.]|nr:hypothetical protein [Anaerotignum sp.]
MKKKVKMITAVSALAIISLLIIPLHSQSPQEPPVPNICPVSAPSTSSRDNTPPPANKAVVADQSPEISTQNSLYDSTTTETDFEPSTLADSKELLTESSTPRDNPTPTLTPSKNAVATKACEPKMGDTRTVDGQKQVYFLGFGWIDDNNEPNECIYVEDMYENGNKIGSMGGTLVDGEGDINKMVGQMN